MSGGGLTEPRVPFIVEGLLSSTSTVCIRASYSSLLSEGVKQASTRVVSERTRKLGERKIWFADSCRQSQLQLIQNKLV